MTFSGQAMGPTLALDDDTRQTIRDQPSVVTLDLLDWNAPRWRFFAVRMALTKLSVAGKVAGLALTIAAPLVGCPGGSISYDNAEPPPRLVDAVGPQLDSGDIFWAGTRSDDEVRSCRFRPPPGQADDDEDVELHAVRFRADAFSRASQDLLRFDVFDLVLADIATFDMSREVADAFGPAMAFLLPPPGDEGSAPPYEECESLVSPPYACDVHRVERECGPFAELRSPHPTFKSFMTVSTTRICQLATSYGAAERAVKIQQVTNHVTGEEYSEWCWPRSQLDELVTWRDDWSPPDGGTADSSADGGSADGG
jgi:hypothetical protein